MSAFAHWPPTDEEMHREYMRTERLRADRPTLKERLIEERDFQWFELCDAGDEPEEDGEEG